MSLLYQPFTKAMIQRDLYTPDQLQQQPQPQPQQTQTNQTQQAITTQMTPFGPKEKPKGSLDNDVFSFAEPPLSPPLSPYQRNVPLNTTTGTIGSGGSGVAPIATPLPPSMILSNAKSYLTTNNEFKLENFKDYRLTIAMPRITPKSYKSDQLSFIDKYSLIMDEERNKITLPMRRYNKRRFNYESDNDNLLTGGVTSGVEDGSPRVRTRRVIKTKEFDLHTDEELSTPSPSFTSPKKKRRPNTSASPSIALQQQMLIDESIPDYSPDAVATLPPNNTKCLKIEWKGQPMDLSQDPNLSKLHPAEVLLASILRLPVAVYLDSKRRLFFEKVARLKSGKQFRRTDAQKACRIDVNKASRLFAAFEKVGWLNDELFAKHL